MLAFPNCKINLGLRIIRKRSDGYHELETAFYPIPLTDILEIVPIKEKHNSEIEYSQSGSIPVPNDDNNLCLKAYQLVKDRFPNLPALKMHLHKEIPTGGGLGGGSADATFVLRLLNNQFNLCLSNEMLYEMALSLGSDCPFFLLNKPCLAFGRGEILKEISLSLQGWQLLLINVGIPISTAEAFQGIVPQPTGDSLEEILLQPVNMWRGRLINQFEGTIFQQYPALEEAKDSLYRAGAVYASMSGSGSTLFGLFKADAIPTAPLLPPSVLCKWYRL